MIVAPWKTVIKLTIIAFFINLNDATFNDVMTIYCRTIEITRSRSLLTVLENINITLAFRRLIPVRVGDRQPGGRKNAAYTFKFYKSQKVYRLAVPIQINVKLLRKGNLQIVNMNDGTKIPE